MIRFIFCGFCEEACPVDAIKLGPEYELADFNRKDFVYTKEMLLDPANKAPKLQFHADVDRSTDTRGVHTSLGTVYRTHHPIGAPDVRERPDQGNSDVGSAEDDHHGPAQAGATPATPEASKQ